MLATSRLWDEILPVVLQQIRREDAGADLANDCHALPRPSILGHLNSALTREIIFHL